MLKQFALSILLGVTSHSLAMAQLAVPSSAGGSAAYGSFGNRTIGGGVSSSRTGTGSSSSGLGSSATGQSGSAGSAAGGGTASGLGQAANGQSNAGGQVTGNERFLRQNRNGAFVGADSGDTSNVFSQQQQGQQGLNSLFGQQGLFSQLNRQAQQNTRNQNQGPGKKPLRIPIRAEIELANPPSSSDISSQLATRMTKLPALAKFGEIQVAMQGRTAVLGGRVPTERAKRLAEGVAMLEPGVSAVQNDLIVDPAATKPN